MGQFLMRLCDAMSGLRLIAERTPEYWGGIGSLEGLRNHPAFAKDPNAEYQLRADLHDDPVAANAWAGARLKEMRDAAQTIVDPLKHFADEIRPTKQDRLEPGKQDPSYLDQVAQQWRNAKQKYGTLSDLLHNIDQE